MSCFLCAGGGVLVRTGIHHLFSSLRQTFFECHAHAKKMFLKAYLRRGGWRPHTERFPPYSPFDPNLLDE